MFGFIRRLIGCSAPRPIDQRRVGPEAAPPASVGGMVPSRKTPAVVLQRDEIINARTRIGGYRFAAQLPESPGRAEARATHEVLCANNIAALAERRLALIQIQVQDWLDFGYQPLIGRYTAFLLDLPADPTKVVPWRETAAAIRVAGARVAMACTDISGKRELIRENVDLLLFDFSSYELPTLEGIVSALKREQPKLELIAENIRSWPEYRLCVSLGIDYCMGSFAACPDEEHQSEEISQSRLVLIDMLNLLRQDADLIDVVGTAKRDPGIVVKLVAMANTPLLGLTQSVTSIDQAIMLLGREQLYRWLSMAMFRAGTGSPRDEVVLEIALARGHFLEMVGRGSHGKAAADELFLVGLLSLLDSLLGVPMAKVIEHLNLSEAIKAVLLNSDGVLGRYLMLAIAVERGHAANVARLAALVQIPLADIERASADALAWAADAVQLSK